MLGLSHFSLAQESAPNETAPNISASEAIAESFQSVMDYVAQTQTEAPAASRYYVITALSLHDIWKISHQGNPYFKNELGFNTEGAAEHAALMKMSIEALVQNNFNPDVLSLPHKNAEAHLKIILAALPAPLPIKTPLPATFMDDAGQNYVHPEWRYAQPLTLSTAAMFRPKGPPSIGSKKYTEAFEEVKRLGEDVSEYRLADDSVTAVFWGDAAGTYTGPGHWNAIALDAFKDKPPAEQLEILLALNVAMYDVSIAAWDSKYHYMAERPTPAIRRLSREDENWKAMGDIPGHPEYVSGHSAFSAAAAEALSLTLGPQPFCSRLPHLWDLTRCFSSFHEAAEEAGQSRVYGGIHFQFANKDGLKLGKDVARHSYKALTSKGIIQIQD